MLIWLPALQQIWKPLSFFLFLGWGRQSQLLCLQRCCSAETSDPLGPLLC